MIEQSADIKELSAALHKAQGAMTGATKDSKNPHFRNSYASLESVIDAAKPALQEAGVSFAQFPGAVVGGAIEITTMLMHVSGQWIRSTTQIPMQQASPQGAGSAITYGCRYALMATLGLPAVDDDAETAMGRGSEPQRQATPARRPEPSSRPRIVEDRTVIDTMIFAAKKSTNKDDLDAWWEKQKPAARELSKEHRAELLTAMEEHAAKFNVLATG